MKTRLRDRLEEAPLLLDGGLAAELARRGRASAGALWTASAVIEAPSALAAAHAAFLHAGADLLETATYQASDEALGRCGLGPSDRDAFWARVCALPREARDALRPEALVVGSLGPYGALLLDRSEYHGRYDLDPVALRRLQTARVARLVHGGCDAVAFETLPRLDEARLCAEILEEAGVEGWISFTLAPGGRTAAGDDLADAARALDDLDCIRAVGVNCGPQDLAPQALRQLRLGTAKPLVVYPNGGSGAAPGPGLDPGPWIDAGAAALGGCCGVDAAALASLGRALRP